MQGLSALSDQAFGRNSAIRLIKINLFLLIFFIMALTWYSFEITHLTFLFKFLRRGLTIDLGDNERNYLTQVWPWDYVD
jgi:hypothetical protein